MDRNSLLHTWELMSHRYGWHLVKNKEIFIDEIIKEAEAHSNNRLISERGLIWHAYSRLLYKKFSHSNNEAAQELFGMFKKTMLLRGNPSDICEEIAQESLLRILVKLPSLRNSSGFLTWALRILSSYEREFNYSAERVEDIDTKPIEQVVDEEDSMEAVNTKIDTKEIAIYIQSWLPNQLEQIVFLRSVIDGDKPRDIAQELNMPASRIRVAKSRAIARLRDEPEFLAWLKNIGPDSPRALP